MKHKLADKLDDGVANNSNQQKTLGMVANEKLQDLLDDGKIN